MNEIIFNTTLIRGAKGATGQGTSYEVPTGTIIAYDGTGTPEGYVETTAPEGMGGSNYVYARDLYATSGVIYTESEG